MWCNLIRYTKCKSLVTLAVIVTWKMALLHFWLTSPGGHIWSLIGPKFGRDIVGARYIITPNYSSLGQIVRKCAIRRSNSELWPLWPWKVGQMQNPYHMWWSLVKCTCNKNFSILAITVCFRIEKDCFQTWPPGGHIWSLIGAKFVTVILAA